MAVPFVPTDKPPRPRSSFRRGLGATICTLALLLPVGAAAKESVATMVARLREDPDFRVRTQAALALGASGSGEAVKPLCEGLDDSSTTVRAASAAALGRLARGGKDCLEGRLGDETNASVKTVIKKALAQVGEGGGVVAPGISGATKFYVAVGPTTDKSGRKDKSVDALVREALVGAAVEAGGEYAVAPTEETTADASKMLKKHKGVRAFFLWPKVNPPDYSGGNLTLRFEVSIFTYPSKSLKAVVPLKLTMPDVAAGDRDSEDELIKMAAEKAFEKFGAAAATLQ